MRRNGWSVELDGGSATVWVLALAAVLGLGVLSVLAGAHATLARHRAGAVADLAALAGADVATRKPGDREKVCEVAVAVAHDNGGRVLGCALAGAVVDVAVAVPVGGPFSVLAGPAQARARAGPPAAP